MKKLLALFALLAVSGIPTLAQERGQDRPLFEINGGYTFQRWDTPPVAQPPSSLNYNGFNAGAAFHVTKWLAAVADISGTFRSQTDPDPTATGKDTSHIYSYLFGPRVYPLGHHKLTPYFHGLVGLATYHIHLPQIGTPPDVIPPFDQTNNDFSFAIGGGVDLSLGKHFALRLGQFDYQQTRFLHADSVASSLSPSNQNNFKYSAGLVVRFGEK